MEVYGIIHTYLYKGNPTNGTPTYRQSSKSSKPPPNVTLTMTLPLTLDHPPANQPTKPKSCFAYCEAQSDVLYMHYLGTNIVLLVFVLLTNIDDNI